MGDGTLWPLLFDNFGGTDGELKDATFLDDGAVFKYLTMIDS